MSLKKSQIKIDVAPAAGSDEVVRQKDMEAALDALTGKKNVIAATVSVLPANTRATDVLTADVNGAFPTVDGVSASLNNEYLIKNEANGVNNGIYVLTVLGDVSTDWE